MQTNAGIPSNMCETWIIPLFPPPYSPHLNIAETPWRIIKGKWTRPTDFCSTETLLYAADRALADVGSELKISYAYMA